MVNTACRGESRVIIGHFYLLTVSPVSNVETNVVEKITLHSEIERKLSKVAQRETKSALGVTNTRGDNSLIIWDSSNKDKFVRHVTSLTQGPLPFDSFGVGR